MLMYMAVPVLIMFGLCILFYILGRYVGAGKKQKLNGPNRTPILEEANRTLKEALEIKSKELEKKNEAYDLIMKENQKLLVQPHLESPDKIDEQKEKVEDAIEPAPRLSPSEDEPAADNTAVHTVSSLYEAVLKGPEEKPEEKIEGEKPEEEPEEKIESKEPKKQAKSKKSKGKTKLKPRKKK